MLRTRATPFPLAAAAALLLASFGAAACDHPDPPAPATGVINIAVTISGIDLDDNITVRIDHGEARPVALGVGGALLTSGAIATGPHEVHVWGVNANCTLDAAASLPIAVQVTAGDTTSVVFRITCRTLVQSVEFAYRYPSLFAGDTTRLVPDVRGVPLPLAGRQVAWSSLAPAVASVDQDGVVTGLAPGFATIRLEVDGVSGTVVAGVLPAPAPRPNREIAYMAGTLPAHGSRVAQLYLVNADGSNPRTISAPGENVLEYAWSPDGSQLAVSYSGYYGGGRVGSYIMSADGSNERALPTGVMWNLDWSPDGSSIVYSGFDASSNLDIRVASVASGEVRNLTTLPGNEYDPQWSPDGRQILFRYGTRPLPGEALWLMAADGTDLRAVPMPPAGQTRYARWSPDGKHIAFNNIFDSDFQTSSIWVVGADGRGLRPMTTNCMSGGFSCPLTPFYHHPAWSPDGRTLAYSRNDDVGFTSALSVVVHDLTSGSTRARLPAGTSSTHLTSPEWSPDGALLAFSGAEGSPHVPAVTVARPDGTGRRVVASGTDISSYAGPRWRP